MKVCKACGQEQSADNWVQSHSKPIGRLCKSCSNKRQLAKLHGLSDPLTVRAPLRPAKPSSEVPSYILDNIKVTDTECWEWQGRRRASGYGVIRFEATEYGTGDYFSMSVHRHVFEHINAKKLTTDRFVCHHCDNPSCCNPAHLFEGSIQDNNADKQRKGRDRYVMKNKKGPHNLADKWQEIVDARALGATRKELATKYGTSIGTIQWIEFGWQLRK